MSPFADKIRQFVYLYKQILKRYLPATAYETKVKTLHIKRKDLKNTNDVDLFHIANRLLHDIEFWLATKHLPASEYSGVQSFQQHIKDFVHSYTISQDKVINLNQNASKAAINAIQLLNQPPCPKIAAKLQENILTLRQFGKQDQIEMLMKALQKKAETQHEFYSPLIENLQEEENSFHSLN